VREFLNDEINVTVKTSLSVDRAFKREGLCGAFSRYLKREAFRYDRMTEEIT